MAFEASQITRSALRVSGFRDAEFDYQLLRTMGLADYGGSTVGEALAAASMIADGDTSSWVAVFSDLADRVERRAEASAAAGHALSAADHYLRAATYHRTAEYYAEAHPAVLSERGRRAQACFARAVALGDRPVEAVSIPFADATLPGYVAGPGGGRPPRGTAVVIGGFDSSAEELYVQLGVAGTARGWRVVTFDGPGQAGCLRRHPELTFRPDWEVPVGAVLDFLAGRDDGPGPVALVGLSFGGHFAIRAAAHDHRVAALVAAPPVVDLYGYMEAWLGDPVFRSRHDIRPEDVAGVPEDLLLPQMRWGMAAVCRRFGVPSLHRFLELLAEFRLDDQLAQVRCPALGLVGEHEGAAVVGQAERFAASVGGEARLVRFGIDDGADAHCQVGNLRLAAQTVFDWLDEHLAAPA